MIMNHPTTRNTIKFIIIKYIYIAVFLCELTYSLKHHLVLTNDHRYQVSVSSFGYNRNGRLDVIVQNLTLTPDPSEENNEPHYGFVMVKSDQAKNPYAARPFQSDYQTSCLLKDPRNQFRFDLMTFSVLPNIKKVSIQCTGDKVIFPSIKSLSHRQVKEDPSMHSAYIHTYNKRAAAAGVVSSNDTLSQVVADIPEQRNRGDVLALFHKCPQTDDYLPLEETIDTFGRKIYSFNFTMLIKDKSEEGMYYLSFQNCHGFRGLNGRYNMQEQEYKYTPTRFNLSMLIVETNWPEIYLSAGAQPLPQMYFMLSVMFFLSGCIWLNFIKRQKENTLKIHSLMTVLVFAKACSLLFHGINYHYIALNGQPVVTWAYIYYATRSVKGALFFITLALIGSGWTFIKHILSPRDKNIIVVIVALQIIAHIAEIILDESTEGEASIEFWAKLCGLIDLFSCVAILILISWSLRHLQEASSTDGKAALNVRKMELFKSFYIISTIYIYVTRIMTYALLSMLSYKYSWLAELFSELATLVYFIVTGYYFQPLPSNPYLLLSTDNDQDEDILFSVDAQEMNGTRSGDSDLQQQDKSALLGDSADGTTRTRRVVEEFV